MQTNHLYNLLPTLYRLRDADRGSPLMALLRVIEEQAQGIEDDISQLYENWFIETCEDWVVPYIGDLIGWQQVHEAGEPGEASTARGRARNKILIPRRELANTIRSRRRKGTLALLELLANDVAGWPARAVEFFAHLGWTQNISLPHLNRGRTVDLREGASLDLVDGPFDELAHTVDVRRSNSSRSPGRQNIPSVGLFISRLRSYSVTRTPAYCAEGIGPHCFTFSALGNDAPLFTRAEREIDPSTIAGEINLPLPIRRRALEARTIQDGVLRTSASEAYYGKDKSLVVWTRKERRDRKGVTPLQIIPAARIVPADLKDWSYSPRRNQVAVDPVLGRIVFQPGQAPKGGVWVSYHYGFSGEIGGGEYERQLSEPTDRKLYHVGADQKFHTINAALRRWQEHDSSEHPHAVIEIADSNLYVEQLSIMLGENQSLQLRAANRKRPILRLLDWHTEKPDALSVTGARGSRFTLDGLLITGRAVFIEGKISEVAIRHSTLVPGWTLNSDCEPTRQTEPSLELSCPQARVSIEHSILGSIQVYPVSPFPDDSPYADAEENPPSEMGCGGIGYGFRVDPICLNISDSILDATAPELEAVGTPGCVVAHARLTIIRSTVIGEVHAHAIDLGENTIFDGRVHVARRQQGCLRFCYVAPQSRTPRRFQCQPELATKNLSGEEKALTERRVKPLFISTRYGGHDYCRLAGECAEEITRGADDGSEIGAFHDLYQPQRVANLRARLDEFLPAGTDSGIFFIN